MAEPSASPAVPAAPAHLRLVAADGVRRGLDLGPAPIVDFDGTIARLEVDWAGLRDRLGVGRLRDLWSTPEGGDGMTGGWEWVATAEAVAAEIADPVEATVAALHRSRTFAVLTNNSSRAVHRFLARLPELEERLALVVGREQLGGPKTDFARFRLGFAACTAAVEAHRGSDPLTYAGDQGYELGFARHLGAHAVAVRPDAGGAPWRHA